MGILLVPGINQYSIMYEIIAIIICIILMDADLILLACESPEQWSLIAASTESWAELASSI